RSVGPLNAVARILVLFFFSSRRRHTRCYRDWSSDVCSSDLLGVAQVLGASLPARAQGPVTWQLGRVQFADTSANAQRALRIDEMSADSTGGFVRITALNDGECVPGAGLPPQGIFQRFLFRWTFSGDVSRLTFPQQFTVRFTIEADGNVPCLDLNPIMQVNVDEGRLDSPLRGARFYWRPELLPAGNHEGSPRIS